MGEDHLGDPRGVGAEGLTGPAQIFHAGLAARARARNDGTAYARHTLSALRATPDIGSDIARIEPIMNTRGGFFACIATTRGGAAVFAKCILSRGREARFWRIWREGRIRTEGERYRLLPPDHVIAGGIATVLVFPAHPALPLPKRRRIADYARHADAAIRALAEFNADHADATLAALFPAAGGGGPPRAVRPGRLETVYGFDRDTARRAARALRAAGRGWKAATAPLEAAPRCLSHLDLGRGNVIFERGKATLLDFGHAAVAPAGADLHTILRYTRPDDAGRAALAELYAAAFGHDGAGVDPQLARLAMEACYAARYTDPELLGARKRNVFEDALRTATALTADTAPR